MFGLAPDYAWYKVYNDEGYGMIAELFNANLISRNAYSFWLDRPADDTADSESMLFLGGSNSSFYVGPMFYYDWPVGALDRFYFLIELFLRIMKGFKFLFKNVCIFVV